MRATLLLARRELGRHPLRTALTAAGVGCGVALVVAIQAINTTTLAAFTDAIDDLAGTAALQVRGQGPFDEAIADAIRALPGVDHAVPILTDTFFAVDPPAAGEALAVYAADVSDGHAVKTLHLVKSGEQGVEDPLGFLVDPASIVITDVFAARTGLKDGAKLRLRTPVGEKTFTVRGILPPGGRMPRTVNVLSPTGVRIRSGEPSFKPARAAKTSVTTTLAGSTRNPSGSSTTCSPERTRWSVFTACPSLTSAA